MNIKQKRVMRVMLAFVMLVAILIPVANNLTGKAASPNSGWNSVYCYNSCYKVNTSSGLALKQSASDSASTIITVPNGAMVYVINITSSLWGYTAYNGKYGYINLSSGATRLDSAPETVAELKSRFDAVMTFFPTNSVWKGSRNNTSIGQYRKTLGGDGPSTCFGYAAEVWRALFGTEMAMAYKSSQKHIFSSTSTMKLVGSSVNGTVDDMKTLLLKARCGDIIQGVHSSCVNSSGQSITTSTGYTGQHTMVVYSVDSEGIVICDANCGSRGKTDNKVENLYKYTWDRLYEERGGAISLYTSSTYPPEKVLPIVGGEITVKNSQGTAASSFYVQDKIKFDASVSNATSIVYHIVNKKTNKDVATVNVTSPSSGASATYTFTKLFDNATSYSVYYEAKNSAGSHKSKSKDFTVISPTVSIKTGDIELETGTTKKLELGTYSPTSNVKFTWTTSDPDVATISQQGVVTAKKAGTVTAIVSMKYTGTGGSVTVTAKVNVKVNNPTYEVSFDVNGGTGDCQPITVEKTKQYGTLPTPSKTGYKFKGWYTAKTGGTQITATSTVSIDKNITLYAQWEAYKYSITFDANGEGGVVSSDAKGFLATYDSALGTLPTATRPGYNFAGWYTDKSGGTAVTKDTVFKNPRATTYYAHWTLASFKVTFDANGGKASLASKTVTYTKTYGDLPTATRTGYNFAGWYTGKNGSGTQITASSEVKITKDTTLYAKWTAKEYTVSFDSDTAAGKYNSIKVKYDSAYGTLPTPVKAGYEFKGWYTKAKDGTLIKSTDIVKTASDHTLYAYWEPGKFTVKFDANGGQTPTSSKTVTYLTTYGALPIPERVGYSFVGWFTSKTDGNRIIDSTKVEIVANTTLYAQWTANTYEISFDTGSDSKFDLIKVVFDDVFGELPTPTKRGYTFVGWYTSEKYGAQSINKDSVLKIGENTTLYAHWKANTYKVTFDPSSGSVDVESMDVVFDSEYGKLPTPVRFGYEFLGWYTESGRKGELVDSNTIVNNAQDIVLYAHWSARRVVVTFDPNNGVCEEKTREYEFDMEFGSFPKPTRTGYTFVGWLQSNGEYLEVEAIVDFVDDVIVVAQWSANSYNIRLDVNGGSFASEDEKTSFTVTYDSKYPQLGTPHKHGYRFVGWKTEDGAFAYSGEIVKITSSQSLTAQWASVVYVVEFDTDGGSLDKTYIKVGYKQQYGELPTPIKNGYSFAGWKDDEGNIVNEDTVYEKTEGSKLYAQWTERMYEITFDPNGGRMEADFKLKLKYGQQYGELPTPTRIGYKFTKWADKDGNAIYSTSNLEVADDTKYYAQWVALVFDVEFDGNGSSMTVPPISVTYGETYDILPEIERNGYGFDGWYDENGNLVTEESIVEITEHTVLTARWTAFEYVLVFDANGGECDVDRMNFTFDIQGGSLPVASKEGCIFVGWFDENGSMFTEDTELDKEKDNIFTARWALTEYSVYFNVRGSINSVLTKTVEYKAELGVLPLVDVYGYEFVCWQYSNGKTANEDDVYSSVSDTVLYAVLVPGKYTVSFYAEGGEPEFLQKTVISGEAFGELPQTVRHGYVLIGWFTEDGIRITENMSADIDDDMNVHARWAKVESDTDGIFRNNSMLATSCEVFAGVDLVLLLLTLLKKRKKKTV